MCVFFVFFYNLYISDLMSNVKVDLCVKLNCWTIYYIVMPPEFDCRVSSLFLPPRGGIAIRRVCLCVSVCVCVCSFVGVFVVVNV